MSVSCLTTTVCAFWIDAQVLSASDDGAQRRARCHDHVVIWPFRVAVQPGLHCIQVRRYAPCIQYSYRAKVTNHHILF